MTDKQPTIFKPIQSQFRAARSLTRRTAIAAALVASSPAPQQPTASFVTLPMPSLPAMAPQGKPSTESGLPFSKSYAQVETLVRPQVVSPKSCELKLGRQRPYRLMGRFSKQEKEDVEARAAAVGLSVNEYIRATSMGSNYKPVDKEHSRVLLALYREFRAQGNNLNQLAKLRNSGNITQLEEESALAALARSHLRTHQAIRNALAHGDPEPTP